MCDAQLSPERRAYLSQRKRRAMKITVLRIAVLVVFLAQWEITARLGLVDMFIVSAPSRMLATLSGLLQSGDLWTHLGASCLETAVGFALGTLLGVLVAVALWWSDTLSRVLEPYLVVLNALPKTALGPIFIVWIGAGTESIIAMTIAISVFVTILNMYVAFCTTDREKLRLMQTFGASKWQTLRVLVLPANYLCAVQYAARQCRPVLGRRHHGRVPRVKGWIGVSDRVWFAGVQHGSCDGIGAPAGGRGGRHV